MWDYSSNWELISSLKTGQVSAALDFVQQCRIVGEPLMSVFLGLSLLSYTDLLRTLSA